MPRPHTHGGKTKYARTLTANFALAGDRSKNLRTVPNDRSILILSELYYVLRITYSLSYKFFLHENSSRNAASDITHTLYHSRCHPRDLGLIVWMWIVESSKNYQPKSISQLSKPVSNLLNRTDWLKLQWPVKNFPKTVRFDFELSLSNGNTDREIEFPDATEVTNLMFFIAFYIFIFKSHLRNIKEAVISTIRIWKNSVLWEMINARMFDFTNSVARNYLILYKCDFVWTISVKLLCGGSRGFNPYKV